ncbi:S8 family serine peptidase [Micromonospora sp. NPDC023737]|uniref:S8 family serine peptidase n=1 Tax=unclassified Micromonospora TaxID=2617518 RepID=UPI0033D90DD9
MNVPPIRRRAALAAVLALALGAATPATAAPASSGVATPPADSPGRAPAGVPHRITLVNGDRVTVTPTSGGVVTEVRGPAGQPVGAQVVTYGDDTYVYPDSVSRYVASGLLDQRLFNVTQLIEDGYDDAHRDRLPLILSYTDAAARAKSAPTGATRVRDLPSVQGAAVEADRRQADRFWSALTGAAAGAATAKRSDVEPVRFTGGVTKVWLDGKVRATLADTTAQIGAPQVWSGGNTGAGVPVAVLDTGVDAEHPDLTGQVAEARSFVPGEEVTDRNGHGTHVASTIAGTGAASDGRERGVAPGVELHVGKVLSDAGEGQDSWIVSGMEWAARDAKARVISMSLGGAPSDGTDLLSRSVNQLSAETGALFTIAAGNSGPDMQTVGAPGSADAALTVGAVDNLDRLAVFSSRGPRTGDNALKPDITAPGVDVLAARSQYSPEGEGQYLTMSGTSMATPHVAGAAALLAATHPQWTGRQLKDALMSTSKVTRQYDAYRAGAGRVDVAAAVSATVFATGVDFTALRWPYEPGQRTEHQVTYTNTGDAPVTLDLSVEAPTAPAGLFTLAADQVTVPAHGTSTVTVHGDLDRMADEDSYAYATVVGAGPAGTPRLHTLVGLDKKGQRVGLSVTTKDRDGAGLPGQVLLKDITRDVVPKLYEVDETGRLDLQVRPGTYSILMHADVPGVHGAHSVGRAVLVAPEIVVGDDARSVTLDARILRQVTAVTPQRTSLAGLGVYYFRSYPDRYRLSDNYLLDPRYDSLWATPTGRRVEQGSFTLGFRWSLIQPPLTVRGKAEEYDDLRLQSGSAIGPEGRHDLDAVFVAGTTPADVARARVGGKVVVVRHADPATALAQADAAAAAGAALMIVVNDGYGRLDAWADVPDPETPLPVASLGRDQGEDLIKRIRRGDVRLTVEGHATPDYLYDLVDRHPGAVPENLTYRPRGRDLARVEVSFRNPNPGAGTWTRSNVSPDEPSTALSALPVPFPAQGERTDWLSADEGNEWLEMANLTPLVLTSEPVSYPAGRRTEQSWFAPVARPRVPQRSLLSGAPVLVGSELSTYGLPSWGDAEPHHHGMTWGAEVAQTTSIYQGDDLIASTPGGGIGASVEPGRPVRLVTEATQDVVSPYSTRTVTEWGVEFPDADPESVRQLPLIQLDYGVETDQAGHARRNARLTVSAGHLDGAWHAGAIQAVGVELSYDDGRTWQRATKPRVEPGAWRLELSAPKSARFASLRVTARDAVGNTVTQTVVRAFGLR